MAYNEIRTINNIQLEDIKAREEIEATKKKHCQSSNQRRF